MPKWTCPGCPTACELEMPLQLPGITLPLPPLPKFPPEIVLPELPEIPSIPDPPFPFGSIPVPGVPAPAGTCPSAGRKD